MLKFQKHVDKPLVVEPVFVGYVDFLPPAIRKAFYVFVCTSACHSICVARLKRSFYQKALAALSDLKIIVFIDNDLKLRSSQVVIAADFDGDSPATVSDRW